MTQTAAIIGGGVIGGGWAARFALMGWNVTVFDPDPDAKRKLDEVFANARRALPMLYDTALPPEGTVRLCATLAEAVAGASWIQESVPERLDIKHRVLADIQVACPMDAVIASSTSGFKPSQLQEGAAAPGQILVAHPFNPVYLLPLAEVVPSPATDAQTLAKAKDILTGIGMYPLHVRAEIDAHIADRFLEAVWREALWLVKDGIATTEEIDNAIRYGFGLRWGQMGLFETYRVAGGEAGMRHFMAQFGPCLQWPWTRLTDVPEFTDDLVDLITAQSDAQSGAHTIRALEAMRDMNLVSMMRALKVRDAAAGALLRSHETALRFQPDGVPMITQRRVIPIDWTDMNGHMNEGRYGQIFSDAAEVLMAAVGAGDAYVAAGNSYFTAETTTKYLAETHAGDAVRVASRVTLGAGKKLRVFHSLLRDRDNALLATCDQFMLHVNLTTRASCLPLPAVQAAVEAFAAHHAEE